MINNNIQTIYITTTINTPTIISIEHNDENITELDPGNYILENYDKNYLEIIGCSWLRDNFGKNTPSLQITFIPKQIGITKVTGKVQLSKINPLFFDIIYIVNIIDEKCNSI